MPVSCWTWWVFFFSFKQRKPYFHFFGLIPWKLRANFVFSWKGGPELSPFILFHYLNPFLNLNFESIKIWLYLGFLSSVQFSRSVVSNSLRPHESQHAGPPCPSPTPGVYSNSCSLHQWWHPTISSCVVPFSPRLQSFPASGCFQESVCIRWPKFWSFTFSIIPSSEYSWLISFRMDWLDLLADLLFIISCFKLLLEGESLCMYMYTYMYNSEWCHTSFNKCLFPEWIYVQKLGNIVCNELWIILPSVCVVGFQGKKMLVMSEPFWQRYTW